MADQGRTPDGRDTQRDNPVGPAALASTFSDYRATLAENRRELVERYRVPWTSR
jgi:hypothetical protein